MSSPEWTSERRSSRAEHDEEERYEESFAEADELIGDPARFAEHRDHDPGREPAISTLVLNRSAIHASVNSTSSDTRKSMAQPRTCDAAPQRCDRTAATPSRVRDNTDDRGGRDHERRRPATRARRRRLRARAAPRRS